MLVEKTDRLYRNLKDWVGVDELNLEVHLVKENVVLSPQARSHEKFMHGIKVLMAKNYFDNLREETQKGMREKAEQGMWPSSAPIGPQRRRADGQADYRTRSSSRATRHAGSKPTPQATTHFLRLAGWRARMASPFDPGNGCPSR